MTFDTESKKTVILTKRDSYSFIVDDVEQEETQQKLPLELVCDIIEGEALLKYGV